jgi:hypothetical protein
MVQVSLMSWAYLLVLLGSLGLPLGVPPLPETQLLSHIAPEECVFYMSSSGMATPDAKSQNQTEQLLAEPELQKTFAKIEKMIRSNIGKSMNPNDLPPGMTADDAVDLAKFLLTQPMAVYVSGVQMGADGPNFRGGAVIKLGDNNENLKTKLEQLTKSIPPQLVQTIEINGDKFQKINLQGVNPANPAPNITIVLGFKKNFFLAAVGEGEMEALLKRAGGPTPKWLAKIRQELPVERVSTVGYLNVKAVAKIVIPMAGPQANVMMDALGISNVNNVASVAGLDQNNYVSKILVSIDGEPQGLMQFATIKPLSANDLGAIPPEATLAVAAKINPAGVFDAYMATVNQTDPNMAADISRRFNNIENQYGFKIRDEILQSLGDNVVLYNSAGQMGASNALLIVQVKDPQLASQWHAKVVQMYEEFSKNMASQGPMAPKLGKTSFAGKDIYSLGPPNPMMPTPKLTWCLTDKELVFGVSAENIQAYLARPEGQKSLAQSPDVAKLFNSDGGATALVYANTQQIFNTMYTMLPIVVGVLKQQGINLDLSLLPPQNVISGHLTPLVASVRRTKSGIEFTERSPVPGLGITQSAPIVAALLMPSLQASRGAAQRAKSINNMKQIMLAMHVYHDANKKFPPAFKADKDGKPLLSWRVLILPFLEENDLYSQFHLDEPWDSDHNKKLIAKMPAVYKSPQSRAGEGKTNYLTIRGENTVFPGKDGIRIADITDGTAFTIALVEAFDDKAVIWTKPDDFEIDSNNPLKGLIGLYPSIFLAGFSDGSVRSLPVSIDPEELKGLFSRNGGEAVKQNQ